MPTADIDQPSTSSTGTAVADRATEETVESSAKPLIRARWFTRQRALTFLTPALLYLGIRQFGLLVLGWLAGANNVTVTGALTSWDGQWYLGIAAGGYSDVPSGLADAFGQRSAATPLAFFPGYPALTRWLSYLPGVDLTSAAFTISVASGVLCAYGLVRLGTVVHSRRVGLILVTLFAASPMAIVLSMAYSEATFCAVAAWALVGVLERKWLLAGVAAAAAGLLRPTAAAVVLTVAIAALIAIVRRRDGWQPWVGGLLAPVGLLSYLGFVAHRTGSLAGWFTLQQQGWNSRFDGGLATLRFADQVLTTGRSVLEVTTVAVLVAAIALVVVAVKQRLAWPLVVYGALVLGMDVGSNGLMNSKARLLLPAFTLLLPAAIGLAKRNRGTMITVLAAVSVASAWFGAYAITAWEYAI